MRAPTDKGNPLDGVPVTGCAAQYKGFSTVPTATQLQQYKTAGNLGSGLNTAYLLDLAQVFHQWVTLCTITTPVVGDYYLQVRTNVALPSALVSSATNLIACTGCTYAPNAAVTPQPGDDTSVVGAGSNSFGSRVSATDGTQVSASGYERMPIYVNVPSASADFNLIRVLPGAAGKTIKFKFYDAADGAVTPGTVTVKRPTDSTDSIAATTQALAVRPRGSSPGR